MSWNIILMFLFLKQTYQFFVVTMFIALSFVGMLMGAYILLDNSPEQKAQTYIQASASQNHIISALSYVPYNTQYWTALDDALKVKSASELEEKQITLMRLNNQ